MTAKITRLRIAGFKSFADAATIDILPGLTGIVGPNGCGKSNVVEALRWSMGESSARALRGGELDDLIFAGTGVRPARSLAEVTVWLEDATGLAPAPFADSAELEITRRAERGAGSDFRLNGKSVRARDVTTLFADLSSGARSSSIISQNRVSTLIAAKPEERRALLEEAAGISGLHARRHDAELKLRQTEANLARAEDLRVQIEARLESLGEQTAQARRYRELAAALRADEAHLHALLHARAELAVTRTASALAQAQAILAEAGALAEAAAAEETRHRDALSPMRQKRDTARAALERHRVLAETAAQEEQDARRALDEATRRVDEGAKDEAAAAARFSEAAALLREDIETGDRLEAASRLIPNRLATAEAERDAAETLFETARGQSEQANEALVQARMARDALSRRREETTAHLARITAELAKLTSTLDALRADLPTEDDLAALATQYDTLDGEIAARRQALAEAEADAQETRLAAELAERALAEGRRLDREREAERQRLSARLGQMLEQEKSLLSARGAATQALHTEAALAEMETAEARAAAALGEARHAEEQARAAASEAATARLEAESRAHTLRERVALAQRDCTATETVLQRARTQADEARLALESAQEKLVPSTEIEAQAEAVKRAEDALAALLAAIARLETDASIRKTDVETHAAAVAEAETTVLRLRAHCDGLAPETPEAASDTVLPLIRQIAFPPELARGLAVALADGLDAPVGAEESLPLAWRPLPPMTPARLPPGVMPLNERVEAPAALDRLLASIGVVTNPQDGFRLQPQLQPGQALVTAEGALWRWDGYRIAADRPNHAARQLERHQAYLALQRQIAEVESTLPVLRAEADARMTARKSTEDALASQRRERATTEQTLARARSDAASCANRAASARLAADAAERGLEIAAAALAEAATRAEDARNALAALPALAEIERQARDLSDRAETARAAVEMAARRRAEAALAAELASETFRHARLRHDSAAGKLETLIPALARLTDDRAAAETALAALEAEARTQSLAVLEADAARHGAARDTALGRLQDLRAGLAKNEADRAACATRHTALSRRRAEALAREAALLPEHAARRLALDEQRAALAALGEPPALDTVEAAAHAARGVLDEAAATLDGARTRLALLHAEQQRIAETLPALRARIDSGTNRLDTLRRDREEAARRLGLLHAALREAEALPDRLHERAVRQAEALTRAGQEADAADRALQEIEAALRDVAVQRDNEAARARAAREDEIRLTERREQVVAALETLRAAGDAPDGPPPADLSDSAETTLRRRVARLIRERDALGPVNLRAEQDHAEARAQADTLAAEQGELHEAVNRLRGSIGHLNREGRERLQAVFAQVDQHFQALFSRMFGGGRAHLGLVGSDDPLEAGLEIFAQPPGKKLSTLSLLSGGEQALTALSLVFAAFKCQPAPICVLDEVDAPLDDANVERLCALTRDMAEESGTRFLVVTHHQLTMAHMNRLFGVTMQERGVSRVLSVDLSSATQFAETSIAPRLS